MIWLLYETLILDSEIRENEGFKNLNLGNVTQSGFKDRKFPFLSEEDVDYMIKFMDQSFEVTLVVL